MAMLMCMMLYTFVRSMHLELELHPKYTFHCCAKLLRANKPTLFFSIYMPSLVWADPSSIVSCLFLLVGYIPVF